MPLRTYKQSGIIPYKRCKDGRFKVMLITASGTGRWIIPKGLVEEGMTPREAAAMEAYEEAGIRGRVWDEPLGTWRRSKWGGLCVIDIYLMEVEEILEEFPEAGQRERHWFGLKKAQELVLFPRLRSLLRRSFFVLNDLPVPEL